MKHKLELPNDYSVEQYEMHIEELQNEIIGLHAVVKSYQQQLEQTIEYRSVERYREFVRYNNMEH